MILNLLISTIDNRILGLKNVINHEKNVVFTISHQITQTLDSMTMSYIKELKELKNVEYFFLSSKGVAKSRNNALKHRVKNSICLICDDDIIYYENSFKKILKEFKEDSSLEFLTFKIKTFDGKDYKRYKKNSFRHNTKSLSNIGIIDVAFKESVIEKYGLKFDERFGPNSKYSIGEDFIFMMDALKRGAKIIYTPMDILQHEDIGTGQILRDDIIFGRGAMFARVFGKLCYILDLYFAIKNRKKYIEKYTVFEYINLLFKGSFDFMRVYR